MAFLDGIFNRQPQQQPQQQQPQQQGQPQGQGQQPSGGSQPASQQQRPNNSQFGTGQSSNGNGWVPPGQGGQQNPNGQQGQQGQQQPQNPLDQFQQLMTPQASQNPNQQQQPQGLFGDGFNPENINKALSGQNFMQSIDPQRIQAALGGDANEFMGVINEAMRSAVSMSMQSSRAMVEHGVKTGTDQFSSGLDSRFRSYELRSQNSKNPVLQHPAAQPFVSAAKEQIARANPKMSPAEVQEKAEEYFLTMAQQLNPAQQQENSPFGQKQSNTNWESFLQEDNSQQQSFN